MREIEAGRVKGEYRMEGIMDAAGGNEFTFIVRTDVRNFVCLTKFKCGS
jgi:hypothetical protein